MNSYNKFNADVAADLRHYNMANVFETTLGKSVLQNFIYFIVLALYIHYGTYNSPGHYLFMLVSLAVLISNLRRPVKNWVSYTTIVAIILAMTTYLFPYNNQSEITMRPLFICISAGMVGIHILFFSGIGMALTPCLYKQGKFITTNLFF